MVGGGWGSCRVRLLTFVGQSCGGVGAIAVLSALRRDPQAKVTGPISKQQLTLELPLMGVVQRWAMESFGVWM